MSGSSFRCALFGHAKPEQGWWGDALYGEVKGRGVDNIGRTHFSVDLECPRCGRSYIAARFHGTHPAILKANEEAKPPRSST